LFTPHPRTLTDNGDYVERGGKAPVAFALSDLLDNSLLATRDNPAAGRLRCLKVTLVLGARAEESYIVVSDNGLGMTTETLKQWCVPRAGDAARKQHVLRRALRLSVCALRPCRAIMNYTVADKQRAEGTVAVVTVQQQSHNLSPGAKERFLNSQLSFFGVGSKNASFFLGDEVTIVTHTAGDELVHELRIDSKELLSRWQENAETTYQSTIVHRQLGDESTLASVGVPHVEPLRAWVEAERAQGADASFTRIIISRLTKPVFLACSSPSGMEQLGRELAHVFHYYIHGENGNMLRPGSSGPNSPRGGELPSFQPEMVLEKWQANEPCVPMPLRSVQDDFETQLIRAAASMFTFTMRIPVEVLRAARARASDAMPAHTEEDATVFGVLRYYPCLSGQETMPHDAASGRRAREVRRAARRASANGSGPAAAALASDSEADDEDDDEAWAENAGEEGGPLGGMFETFWQGRLIPDTMAPALPFIKNVFSKSRSAQDKDELPDEVSRRLRGQLFFGPALLPTRNKLSFRDHLPNLLPTAKPERRHLDRDFKDWVIKCHREYDRGTELSKVFPAKVQAKLRAELKCDNVTLFETATGVLRSNPREMVHKGESVLLKEKQTLIVARIIGFAVDAKLEPSTPTPYACSTASVVFVQLPEKLYGAPPWRQLALRRVQRKLNETDIQEWERKEWEKAPSYLSIKNNPAWASGLEGLEAFRAGAPDAFIPDLSVAVCSPTGKGLKTVNIRGEKYQLIVTQKLLYLGPDDGSSSSTATSVVLFATSNSSPLAGPVFWFYKNAGTQDAPLMAKAGRYELQLIATHCPGVEPVSLSIHFKVVAGDAASILAIGAPFGGGEVCSPLPPLRLGLPVPRVDVRYADEFGNLVNTKLPKDFPKPCVEVAGVAGVTAKMTKVLRDGETPGLAQLKDVKFNGSGHDGMACFLTMPNAITSASATISVCAAESRPQITWVQGLLPGLPASLRILDAGPQGFCADPSGNAATPRAVAGGPLPRLRLQCLDAWGNATAPVDSVSPGWHLELRGTAIPGDFPVCLRVDDSGVADTSFLAHGVRINSAGIADGAPTQLDVAVCCVWDTPETGGAHSVADAGGDTIMADADAAPETAVATGLPPAPVLNLRVLVSTTRAPARFAIQSRGRLFEAIDKVLPLEDGAAGGAPVMRSVIRVEAEDLVAGTVLSNLEVALLDASGRSCATTEGVLLVSWVSRNAQETGRGRRGNNAAVERAVTFEQDSALTVPPVTLPSSVLDPGTHFLRFTPSDKSLAPIDATVEFWAHAAEPFAWRLVARTAPSSQAGSSADASAHDAGLAVVACDTEFMLCISAEDRFQNPCPEDVLGDAMPNITVRDHNNSELGLLPGDAGDEGSAPRGEWRDGVYMMRVRLRGPAGDVTLRADPPHGPLRPASLTLQLQPGPPAGLAMSVASSVAPGMEVPGSTRTVLERLTVRLVDASGNEVPCGELSSPGGVPLEVQLHAIAEPVEDEEENEDADAAQPQQRRGAKVEPVVGRSMQKKIDAAGCAEFGNIRVTCPGSGRYQLKAVMVQPKGSRSADASLLAALEKLQPALLVLKVVPLNRVTKLFLSLAATTILAGDAAICYVHLTTEDGQPVPDDALDGLRVTARPTGAGSLRDSGVIELERLSDDDGDDGPPASGASQIVTFVPPDDAMRMAGTYALSAEYRETRQGLVNELRPDDRKQDARLDAPGLTVQPGPAKQVSLLTLNAQDTRLHAVLSGGAKERCMVQNLKLCLRDEFGNQAIPPPDSGLKVRLLGPEEGLSRTSELPQLAASESGLRVAFDAHGRCTFSMLSLQDGTGRLPEGSDSMRLRLIFTVDPRPATPVVRVGGSQGGGIKALQVPVDVTDTVAKRNELEKRNAEKSEQVAAKQAAKEAGVQLQKARRALDTVTKAFMTQARKCLSARQLSQDVPARGVLERALQDAQVDAAAPFAPAAAGPVRQAKFGNSTHTVVKSLQHVLGLKNADVIGCAASLAYVQDDVLCRMMSWHVGSRMLACVVTSEDTMMRLREALRKQSAFKTTAICPFVSLDYLTSIGGADMTLEDAIARYSVAGESSADASRKANWLRAACAGTDPPLTMQLLHRDSGRSRQQYVPVGLIGHAINLIRPAIGGHRRTLWFALIGDALVFDTVKHAGAYRKWCVGANLRCPTLISLDCERLAMSGILEGGKPPPARLTDMESYFASAPAQAGGSSGDDDGGAAPAENANVAALRQLLLQWDHWHAKRLEVEAAESAVQAASANNDGGWAEEAPRSAGKSKRRAADGDAGAAPDSGLGKSKRVRK